MRPSPATARSPVTGKPVCSTLRTITLLALLVGSTARAQDRPAIHEPTASEPAIDQSERNHWSYQTLERPSVPDVRDRGWPRNPIDHFVLSRLENHGLSPLPPADARTLIRRLTFDLTGLPPTPQEIDVYCRDSRPDAYQCLVDRLLASDAYGARWAQHWLDLARFAETDGFEHDKVRPNAWRYRDWVIHALNADMPFSRFVQMQLAGDEIAPDEPAAQVATGFLLCGPDMPDINLQSERRHNVLNEMTSTVGAVLLGLQVGCAQCHDHKFDPISQLDFYRFRAFFDNSELFQEHSIATKTQHNQIQEFEQQRGLQWQQTQQRLDAFHKNVRMRLTAAGLDLTGATNRQLKSRLNEQERQTLANLTRQLQRIKQRKAPALPLGRVMRERTEKLVPSFSYIRGDFRRQGPTVRAAYLRIINTDNEVVTVPDAQSQPIGRRSQLAHWITRRQNPLLSRVIVNRIWQHHFGRGFSNTDSDFGTMGEEPTHPLLLDWLACELPHRQWSLKQLHRLLVTSATYRQSSRPTAANGDNALLLQTRRRWRHNATLDPENHFLWRMRRRRLEGEAIRDSMLFVSEQLSQRRGGPGIRPPLPPEQVATLLRNQWPVSPDRRDHARRSIYLFVRRNLRFPILDTFDKPDTNTSCGRRNRSTTAPQALMLLNSRDSLTAARHLARRITDAHQRPADQVTACFLTLFGRPPQPDERRLAMDFLSTRQAQAGVQPTDRTQTTSSESGRKTMQREMSRLAQLGLTLFNLNEFVYVD